jgi:hypothetical protein
MPGQKRLSRVLNGHVAVQTKRNSRSESDLLRSNKKYVRRVWGRLPALLFDSLAELTQMHGLSVAAGHLQLLDGRWYITHSGLLRVGYRNRCTGIRAALQARFSDPMTNRWVFKATVYKRPGSKGFVGYGDADPSNVSPMVSGAEMRIAETRAVNRALRKAYGIGLCSVEELGWSPKPPRTDKRNQASSSAAGNNGYHNNGQPRLRDQLCLLIRRYNLDPNLVKAYAAHFCGTQTLKGASRELVESFISHLSSSAKEDLDGLVCKLNSYSQPAEVKQ